MNQATRTRATVVSLVALLMIPTAGAAQSEGRLSREQIAATGASTARDAISQLAPHWLSGTRDGRTVVYVNGSPRGGIDELSQIPAELVTSVEYLAGMRVNDRLTGESARGVGAAIFVSTGLERAGRSATLTTTRAMVPTVTVHFAVPVAAGPGNWEEAIMGGGWADERTARDADHPLILVSGRFDIGDRFFIDLLGWRETASSTESYRRSSSNLYSTVSHLSQGLALVGGVRVGAVRLGAGPALVNTRYDIGFGECGCIGGRERIASLRGLAVEATASLRVYGPVVVELRALAQRTGGDRVDLWSTGPEAEIDGNRFTASAGIGVGRR